jgi:hypothetical protein
MRETPRDSRTVAAVRLFGPMAVVYYFVRDTTSLPALCFSSAMRNTWSSRASL